MTLVETKIALYSLVGDMGVALRSWRWWRSGGIAWCLMCEVEDVILDSETVPYAQIPEIGRA